MERQGKGKGKGQGSESSKEGDAAMFLANNPNNRVNYLEIGIAILTVGWGIYSLFSGGGTEEAAKMMKAPGQSGVRIARDVFEKDPSSYFRNLRKN